MLFFKGFRNFDDLFLISSLQFNNCLLYVLSWAIEWATPSLFNSAAASSLPSGIFLCSAWICSARWYVRIPAQLQRPSPVAQCSKAPVEKYLRKLQPCTSPVRLRGWVAVVAAQKDFSLISFFFSSRVCPIFRQDLPSYSSMISSWSKYESCKSRRPLACSHATAYLAFRLSITSQFRSKEMQGHREGLSRIGKKKGAPCFFFVVRSSSGLKFVILMCFPQAFWLPNASN